MTEHTYDVTRPYAESASRSTVSEPGTTALSARTLAWTRGVFSYPLYRTPSRATELVPQQHMVVLISSRRAGRVEVTVNDSNGPDTNSQGKKEGSSDARAFCPFSVLFFNSFLVALAKSTECKAPHKTYGLGMWACIRETAGDAPVAGRHTEPEEDEEDGW